MVVKYIGKCLLLEEKGDRVLVIGDLHLGYVGSMRESGMLVPSGVYEEMIGEFEKVFEICGKVNKIILVGDLKHEFGKILREEWEEILNFLDYLKDKCEEIVIIRGNHDNIIDNVIKKRDIKCVNYFIWKSNVFLHGDRDFKEIYNVEISMWVMGHAHPAVIIEEKKGSKKEKYKCFLTGNYRNKKVIIVPSFFSLSEGTDVKELFGKDLGLVWNFDLSKFRVGIVSGDYLEVLDFGKLKNLR